MRAFLIGVYRGLCLIGLLIFTALWIVAHLTTKAVARLARWLADVTAFLSDLVAQ